MPSQKQIREDITAKIIEALEKGVKPWRRPWTISRILAVPRALPAISIRHQPTASRTPQHTIQPSEPVVGNLPCMEQPGMYGEEAAQGRGAGPLGGQRRPLRPYTKTVVDKATGQEDEQDYYLMRYFTVFNADQVQGKVAERLQVKDEPATGIVLPDYQPAEELIAATGADIRHGGDQAYYSRPLPNGSWPNHTSGDYIMLPPKHRFDPVNAYYETAIHELAHWSEIRTGWDHGKQGYAMGELAAEIAASFLSTELGIPQGETLENHAAYLQSWLKEMKNDPSYVFKASTQASKAADYLLAFARKEELVAAA